MPQNIVAGTDPRSMEAISSMQFHVFVTLLLRTPLTAQTVIIIHSIKVRFNVSTEDSEGFNLMSSERLPYHIADSV